MKTITWWVVILGAGLGLLCLVFFAPFGNYAYAENRRYQADVAIVLSIAKQLGYTPETQIRLYREHEKSSSSNYTSDFIRLVVYTPDSWAQFDRRLYETGWTLRFVESNLAGAASQGFIQNIINYGSPEKVVTLNGYYRSEDFDWERQYPPGITVWGLSDDQTLEKHFIIYYLEAAERNVWEYDGHPLPGNIILIEFDRNVQSTPGVPAVP